MYATQSTTLYWVEYEPGKFARRIKQVTKDEFKKAKSLFEGRGNKKTRK